MPSWSFIAAFMSGIASFFKGKTSKDCSGETTGLLRGKRKNDSSHGSTKTKEAGFQRAITGGFLTKATVLKNETSQTLYLRDKVGAAYGKTRYQVPAHSSMEVMPLQHTFFRMLAYAVEEDGGDARPDQEAGLSQREGGKPPRKKSTDTYLTIDSDQLADNSEIRIILTDGKYKLGFTPRR